MSDEPRDAAQKAQEDLSRLAEDFRAALRRTDDPQLKAMLETSAEALLGLHNAFADYLRAEEPAWEAKRKG